MTMLRSLSVAVALLALPGLARAQDQEQLKKNLEKKLEADFLKKTKWITDYDEAKSESKKSKKLIFAYFTRSYSP